MDHKTHTTLQRDRMRSIGDLLSQRRKEMNISLKEAENATSIRMNYLQALENGEMDKIISPVYAQGFFKQYAIFLGLEGENLIKENHDLFIRPDAQDFAYGIGTLEYRGNPGSNVKWFPNAIWILTFILSLLAAWYMARYFEVI